MQFMHLLCITNKNKWQIMIQTQMMLKLNSLARFALKQFAETINFILNRNPKHILSSKYRNIIANI